jgi:hypothetical protein
MSQPARASTMGVPRMTATQYRKYTLISRPYYDDKLAVWIPDVSVIRVFGGGDHNNFYFHQMKDFLNQSFEREEQALCLTSSLVALALKPSLQSALNQSKVIYARRRTYRFDGGRPWRHLHSESGVSRF